MAGVALAATAGAPGFLGGSFDKLGADGGAAGEGAFWVAPGVGFARPGVCGGRMTSGLGGSGRARGGTGCGERARRFCAATGSCWLMAGVALAATAGAPGFLAGSFDKLGPDEDALWFAPGVGFALPVCGGTMTSGSGGNGRAGGGTDRLTAGAGEADGLDTGCGTGRGTSVGGGPAFASAASSMRRRSTMRFAAAATSSWFNSRPASTATERSSRRFVVSPFAALGTRPIRTPMVVLISEVSGTGEGTAAGRAATCGHGTLGRVA